MKQYMAYIEVGWGAFCLGILVGQLPIMYAAMHAALNK